MESLPPTLPLTNHSSSSTSFGWRTHLPLKLGVILTLGLALIGCSNPNKKKEERMELMLCMELFMMMAQSKGYKPVMFYDDGITHAMESTASTSEGVEYAQFIASLEDATQTWARLKGFKKIETTCHIGGQEVPVWVRLGVSLKA